MPLRPGNNVLIPKPGYFTEHLWVVLAGPDERGRVIIANLTSLRPGSDTTVVMTPREHPFVSRDTVVFYADGRIAPADAVEAAIHRYQTFDDFQGDLLVRLQRGLFASNKTPDDVKALAAALLPDLCADQSGSE